MAAQLAAVTLGASTGLKVSQQKVTEINKKEKKI